MALYSFINRLPGRIASIIKYFKSTTSKLQKTASSIGFIEHALYHHITPNFASVKGQFLHKADKWKAEKSKLFSHLNSHRKLVVNLCIRYDELLHKLKKNVGELFTKCIVMTLNKALRPNNIQQFLIKNKKLFYLKKKKFPKNVI